jgi:glycerophosphoryl diester phosphodiesterase
MEIISHRGYWKKNEEKNTKLAFKRSFNLNFGTETDVRDYEGKLVISHDIATKKSMLIDDFFQMYKSYNDNLSLALNIKSDGLQKELKNKLEEYNIENYFVFDMAVPDGLLYLDNFNTFTRQSEYEKEPSFYEKAFGIWIDAFINENWITEKILETHLKNGKKICIVSPDLHRREYEQFWSKLKIMKIISNDNIILCTDYPEKARRFFDEE